MPLSQVVALQCASLRPSHERRRVRDVPGIAQFTRWANRVALHDQFCCISELSSERRVCSRRIDQPREYEKALQRMPLRAYSMAIARLN